MYANVDDMIGRFGQDKILNLAFVIEDDMQIDQEKIEVALQDAAEVINSYVAAKHALPLSVIPPSLKRICCNLALYFLYKDVKPADVRQSYEDAVIYLKDVSKGIVVLEDSQTGAAPKQSDDVVYRGSSERLFSRKKMEGF